jgi:ribulose 1,5-bisphosphate synthetase/thiazole synthase
MSTPTQNPSSSYWQTKPHRLATYRSQFPAAADVVIIGSGITGVSIARTLLEEASNLKVVLVDTRALCNGATGRNGGHCNPCILL